MSGHLTHPGETSKGQIKEKMRPSPPLQLKLRGFCLKLGTGSPISFPSRGNNGYLNTTCSMEAKKSIRDSLKYCFADASIDYMQFLEECRKAKEEGKMGQAKAKVKMKVAEATLSPPKDDMLSRQLKYQQHQIDTLVGQV